MPARTLVTKGMIPYGTAATTVGSEVVGAFVDENGVKAAYVNGNGVKGAYVNGNGEPQAYLEDDETVIGVNVEDDE